MRKNAPMKKVLFDRIIKEWNCKQVFVSKRQVNAWNAFKASSIYM